MLNILSIYEFNLNICDVKSIDSNKFTTYFVSYRTEINHICCSIAILF